ncbi:MAG: hypothetical protein M3Z21_02975 [Pseudomonadota bacterium]|nr:hypothetical protein [Pseudomonadota bacterium]
MNIVHWQVEDTFFGAILGAFLGTFFGNLSILDITFVIIFFILFPAVLRKAEKLSIHALVLASFCSLLWIVLFVYDLYRQSTISVEKGIALIIIFLGWMISTNFRIKVPQTEMNVSSMKIKR